MVQVAISRIFALTLLLKRADINYFVKNLRPAADWRSPSQHPAHDRALVGTQTTLPLPGVTGQLAPS